MSFTAGDCKTGITGLLMNRAVADAVMYEGIRKAVLELTEDYKHPLLEATGPIKQLVAFQNVYAPNFFLVNPADQNPDVSKVNSFFLYTNPYTVPSSITTDVNSGYNLKFRSMDSIEVLLNIAGLPIYWSRNNNQIYITMPDNSYYLYMRYQKQHPHTDAVNGFSALTAIQMADSWQEVLEYAAALRIAPQVNLADKKEELHSALYGDQKFQTSGGIEGAPGLIFGRTSQRNRDQGTTTRRMRLRMGNVG
jgi:hypothetical protein